MSEFKIKIHEVTKKTVTVPLCGDDIVQALRSMGHKIPDGATVRFLVPGGGDWSHAEIAIDAENPVYVEWTEEQERVL